MKLNNAEFVAGGVFVVIGAGAAIMALSYGIGAPNRPGAGAFPVIVGLLLACAGIAQMVKGYRLADAASAVLPFDLRAMGAIVAALIFGGITLTSLGVLVAVPGSVVIACFAAGRLQLVPTLALAAFLTAFAWLVFIVGLGLRLPLLPGVW
ncbi:MAG: tripartite tricarboxylate transporter TctB family protein [Devosia sp.]